MRQFISVPSRQRGFVAVFAAIAMIAMLSALALAIDVGRLYTAQRDIQKLADIAALDAARVASGCSGPYAGQPASAGVTSAEVIASLQRNGVADDQMTVRTELGRRLPVTGIDGQTGALLGFEPLPETSPLRSAVRVTLSRAAPRRIIPGITGDSDLRLVASAVAAQPAMAELSIGSDTLSLHGGLLNSVIGGLLCPVGDSSCQSQVIALDVAGSSGLLTAGVTLEQLATAVDLTVQDLANPLVLEVQAPVASEVLNGLAGALSGTVNSSVTTLLSNLAQVTQGNTAGVPLGQLLGTVTDVASNVPFVSLMDLVIGLGQAAQAGSGGSPIALNLGNVVNIPNVAELHAFVKIIEPPQFSGMGPAGQTSASTAQVQVQLRLLVDALSSTTNTLNGVLALLGTSVNVSPIKLGVDVDVAKAEAFLDALQCPSEARNNGLPVATLSARAAAAEITLGSYSGNGASAPPLIPGTAALLSADVQVVWGLVSTKLFVNLAAPVSAPAGGGLQVLDDVIDYEQVEEALTYIADGAPDAPPSNSNPQRIGSSHVLSNAMAGLFGSLSLSTSSSTGSSQLCVLLTCVSLSSLLDPLLAGVNAVLGPLLTSAGGLVDSVLDPLLNALGVQVGGATVTLHAVEIPQPKMVTTDVAVAETETP